MINSYGFFFLQNFLIIKYSLHIKCIFKTEYPMRTVSNADSHHKLFNLVAQQPIYINFPRDSEIRSRSGNVCTREKLRLYVSQINKPSNRTTKVSTTSTGCFSAS